MKHRGRGKNRLAELEWRKRATKKTLAEYRNKAFDWSAGVTCVHLCWAHLKHMGHRPPKLPKFDSALAAKRALGEAGFGSVTALLDSMLERIPPAFMRLGDVAVVEGSDGMDSIVICTGPLALLGWLPDGSKMEVYLGNIADVTGAWRV